LLRKFICKELRCPLPLATHDSPFCRHRREGSIKMGNEHKHRTANYNLKNQLTKTKQNKEAVVRATEITPVLPTVGKKYSRNIPRDILNSSRYFKIFKFLFHEFSQKPYQCCAKYLLINTRPEGAGRVSKRRHREKRIPHPRNEWELFLWPYAHNIQHCFALRLQRDLSF
jgi:hypothetical protein